MTESKAMKETKIKVEGDRPHLTSTERKAIKAVIQAGHSAAKVGRKTYYLAEIGDSRYNVRILWKEFDNSMGRTVEKEARATVTLY